MILVFLFSDASLYRCESSRYARRQGLSEEEGKAELNSEEWQLCEPDRMAGG
jgi:hypothetical protein